MATEIESSRPYFAPSKFVSEYECSRYPPQFAQLLLGPYLSLSLSLSELTNSHHACLHCRPSKCGVRFRFRDTTSNGRTEKGEKRRAAHSHLSGVVAPSAIRRPSASPNPNVRRRRAGRARGLAPPKPPHHACPRVALKPKSDSNTARAAQ